MTLSCSARGCPTGSRPPFLEEEAHPVKKMAKPEHDVSSTTHRATAASNASPSPAKKKKTTPKRLLATWWLEILSFLLAGLALIALAVTLYRYEHRPVAEWPLLITINALVSIYGAMFESSMLFVVSRGLAQNKWLWFGDWSRLRFLDYFDQAARGPAGAYRLCWKAGVRCVSFASMLGVWTLSHLQNSRSRGVIADAT